MTYILQAPLESHTLLITMLFIIFIHAVSSDPFVFPDLLPAS